MSALLSRLFLVVFLVGFGSAQGEIYQWTDDSGKHHFGDKKPEGREAVAFEGHAAVTFMGYSTVSVAGKGRVRVFVTQNCPFCKKAKAFLNKRGTPFDELDVEKSYLAKTEYQRLGAVGVPVILVGKQRMNGFNADELKEMLAAAGL